MLISSLLCFTVGKLMRDRQHRHRCDRCDWQSVTWRSMGMGRVQEKSLVWWLILMPVGSTYWAESLSRLWLLLYLAIDEAPRDSLPGTHVFHHITQFFHFIWQRMMFAAIHKNTLRWWIDFFVIFLIFFKSGACALCWDDSVSVCMYVCVGMWSVYY